MNDDAVKDSRASDGVLPDLVLSAVGVERSGTIDHFDEAAGLGVIADEHGATVGFHCTQIADGTRTIAEGTPVSFQLHRSNLGMIEATKIRSTH